MIKKGDEVFVLRIGDNSYVDGPYIVKDWMEDSSMALLYNPDIDENFYYDKDYIKTRKLPIEPGRLCIFWNKKRGGNKISPKIATYAKIKHNDAKLHLTDTGEFYNYCVPLTRKWEEWTEEERNSFRGILSDWEDRKVWGESVAKLTYDFIIKSIKEAYKE